jgi:hypothetical protein
MIPTFPNFSMEERGQHWDRDEKIHSVSFMITKIKGDEERKRKRTE